MIQASVDSGAFSTFFLPDGMYGESLIEAIGAPLDGSYGTVPGTDSPGSAKFVEISKAAGFDGASAYSGESYDAAALILTNSALSMPVLIGILMLMGIVTKNAILLIDFAIEMRNQGMDRFKAVIEAVSRRTNRPVPAEMAPRRAGDPPALVADPLFTVDALIHVGGCTSRDGSVVVFASQAGFLA